MVSSRSVIKLFRSLSSPIPTPSVGFAKLLRAQLSPPPFGACSLRSLSFPATGSEAKPDSVIIADGLTKLHSQPMLTLFADRSFHFFGFSNSNSESDSESELDSDSSSKECTNIIEEPPLKNPVVVGGSVKSYTIKEDDEAMYASFDMPVVRKKDLKIWVEKNTSMIERSYLREIELELDEGKYVLDHDQIKAEFNNGVLNIVIPKVKLEDQK